MRNKKGMLFAAYTPLVLNCINEAQIKRMADGGVHYAILGYDEFFTFDREKQNQILDWLEKYDVEYIMHDQSVLVDYSDTSKENFDASKADNTKWYRDRKGYAGNHLIDEPGTDAYNDLGKSVSEYQKLFPGKIPWINLLPMYANKKQLAGGAWMSSIEYYQTPGASYEQYLEEYIQKVPTDYMCVDIYPCFHQEGIKTTYPGYIKNIEMFADACRRSGREFWCCLQSCTWSPTGVRVPDDADMRWQIYSLMAYGIKLFLYYIYATRPRHYGCPLNRDGGENPMYYICKRITEELDSFASVYSEYKNLGAFSYNYSDEKTPYLKMDNPYTKFDTIEEIKCEDALLVGCFAKNVGKGNAFVITNMSDLVLNKTINISLKLNGKKVIAYIGKNAIPVECKNGYYDFTLKSGNGVFVTVE